MQDQPDDALLKAAALRAMDDATAGGDFDPERSRIVGVKLTVSARRKQGLPVLNRETDTAAKDENINEDTAPPHMSSNERELGSNAEAVDTSAISSDDATGDLENPKADREGKVPESDLSIDTQDYKTASEGGEENEAHTSDPLTPNPIKDARVTPDEPSDMHTQQQRYERDVELMEEAALRAIEKAKSSGELDPEKSAIQGVRVTINVKRVEGQADSSGGPKILEETNEHAEMDATNKVIGEKPNSEAGTDDDQLSGVVTPKHDNLQRQKDAEFSVDPLHESGHAPHPEDIPLSLDEDGDFAGFVEDDIVQTVVPFSPEVSTHSIPRSGAETKIVNIQHECNRDEQKPETPAGVTDKVAEEIQKAESRASSISKAVLVFNREETQERGYKEKKIIEADMDRMGEQGQEIKQDSKLLGAAASRAITDAASTGSFSPERSSVRGVKVVVSRTQRRTHTDHDAAYRTEEETINTDIEGSIEGNKNETLASRFLLSPQVETAVETECMMDDTFVTANNVDSASMQLRETENGVKGETSEPSVASTLEEEAKLTEAVEYKESNEDKHEPPPENSVGAEYTSHTHQSQFGISQRMYGTAKCLWAFGKTVPIGGRMLALSEDIASSVLSWGSKGQVENFASLDEEFIRPHVQELDEKVADPAINTTLRVVSSAVEKGGSFIRPTVESIFASLQGRFGFISHQGAFKAETFTSTVGTKDNIPDTTTEPPSLPPAQ